MSKPIMIFAAVFAVTIAGATIAAKTNRQDTPKLEMNIPSKSLQVQPIDSQTINPNTQGTIPFAPPMPGGMMGGMGAPQQMPGGMIPGMGPGMGGGMQPMMPQMITITSSMTTAQDGSLYVLRGNTLYKYSADLTLQKSVELPAPPAPHNPQQGMMPMQNPNAPRPMGAP
jgi:hypothetical protein